MLAFFRYGMKTAARSGGILDTIYYYFPVIRIFGGEPPSAAELPRLTTYVRVTPFLIVILITALLLLLRALFVPPASRGALVWPAAATLVFFYIHIASVAHLPELLSVHRNAAWFAMSIILLITVAIAELASAVTRRWEMAPARYAHAALAMIVVIAWLTRVPDVRAAGLRRLYYVDQTGHALSAYATLRIEQEFEPFTWTLVTYGQEFPMVLGKGFHIAGAEFLAKYSPSESPLRVPTRYVFVVVEKNPHAFQINDWATRFSRADIEGRLQTWCYIYQTTHRNIRVYLEDENVRVYMIEQSEQDLRRLTERR